MKTKMRIAILLGWFLAAAALRAEPYFFQPEGWAVGTEFPDKPRQSESRTPKPEGEILESRAMWESGNEAFTMSRIRNPVPIRKERLDAAYDGAKNGMLRLTKATLISEKKIEILGRDARRYVAAYNGGKMVFEVRMLIIGQELFMFMHVHAKGESSTDEAEAFFGKIAEKNGE